MKGWQRQLQTGNGFLLPNRFFWLSRRDKSMSHECQDAPKAGIDKDKKAKAYFCKQVEGAGSGDSEIRNGDTDNGQHQKSNGKHCASKGWS
jgi:hypothetical protein